MADTRELGPVAHISAEAIGEPGRRRFRLRVVGRAGDSASLWLEKEQLSGLGDAIETILKEERYQYTRVPLDDREPDATFPLAAGIEFQAAQLSMGVNRDTERIVVVCAETADADDPGETVSLEIDYRRGHELRGQIAEVVAAGRQPCPLSGGPMDPAGHACVRSNGHHPH